MISGIKIYDRKGVLKEEISRERAINLYNESHKKIWSLSPTEKNAWKRLKAEKGN